VALVEISVSLMVIRGLSAILFLLLLHKRERRHLVLFVGFLLFAIAAALGAIPFAQSPRVPSLAGAISVGASGLIAFAMIAYLRPGALRGSTPILFLTIGAAAVAVLAGNDGAVRWFLALQAIVFVLPVFEYGRLRHEAKRVFPAAPALVLSVFGLSSAYAVLSAIGELGSGLVAGGAVLVSTTQIAVFIFAEHSIVLNDARRTATRLARAEEAVGIGLWERNATNGKASWSAGHFQIFGLPPDSTSAPNWEEFLSMIHPDDRSFIENSQWTETSTGTADLIQYRIVRPDGEVRWVSSKAIAIDSHMSYGIAVDITALMSTEEKLAQSLRQKDALIAEIQHRVKNNLQIISSMFNLQFVSIHNPVDTPSEIERFRGRLETMAVQQSLVLDSADAAEVEMQPYVQQLLTALPGTPRHGVNQPSIHANMNGIFLEMSPAITVGSIISEVASSLTDRPAGGNQTVQIELKRERDHYRLAISSELEETSLEMALVRTYVSQLGGTLATDDPGAALVIAFRSHPFANQ
jgi:two-component sensor histidine kinase/PAS domain-containing protein